MGLDAGRLRETGAEYRIGTSLLSCPPFHREYRKEE